MSTSPRAALAAMMIAGLLLAGCAEHPTTRAQTPATPPPPRSTSASGSTSHPRTATNGRTASHAALPDSTGIAACDDYLSSYLACHRAAGIFVPDQLQSRYEAMRTNLLRDSQDPDIRPQLAERCNSLARSLREALHGKSCAANPAPETSSP
ncbi:MAG: hypothetical protein EPN69_07985 [Rhodanobacter sp.]|nr:MAG: hypothetical protein EPN69_07985 [Rhodanobacter sp.]TAM42019.1 MAG: hypothetical protein EPN58_04350 [Rhodanobacter sp.]TAN26002.1 MAG: hypothetical protein EPN32_08315 [Rhodanobacter sp.]